jgi:hypothetical protein
MKKYKKLKHGEEVGATDILFHAIGILDIAGEIAAKAGNFEQLMVVYEGALGASEQLIALAINGEEETNNERSREQLPYGFVQTTTEPSPEDHGVGVEEDQ